jgi:hypothetical protein
MNSSKKSSAERRMIVKKVFALALMLCMFVIPARGEENDLGSMGLEELLSLQKAVNLEVNLRVGSDKSSQIGIGQYVVGTMIKAGTYEFIATESTETNDRCRIEIFLSEEAAKSNDAWYRDVTYTGATAILTLNDGMILNISWGSGRLVAVDPTWAP